MPTAPCIGFGAANFGAPLHARHVRPKQEMTQLAFKSEVSKKLGSQLSTDITARTNHQAPDKQPYEDIARMTPSRPCCLARDVVLTLSLQGGNAWSRISIATLHVLMVRCGGCCHPGSTIMRFLEHVPLEESLGPDCWLDIRARIL